MNCSLLPSRSLQGSALGRITSQTPQVIRSKAFRVRASKGQSADGTDVADDLSNNQRSSSTTSTSTSNNTPENLEEQEDLGLGLKSVWYAAEALGNVIGATRGKGGSDSNETSSPSSPPSFSASNPLPRAQALEMLKRDYEVDYFISGKGEMRAYDDNCEFRDPFAGFKGTDRFKKNVSNLGSSLEEAQTDLNSWEEDEGEGSSLKTRWRFSGIVGLLPWRPRLAAAGSTTHVFDPVRFFVPRLSLVSFYLPHFASRFLPRERSGGFLGKGGSFFFFFER